MSHATILEWLKQPGETVVTGDALVEIETDKASTELVSEVDGVLGPHLYAEGDEVAVGEALVEILQDGVTAEPPAPGTDDEPTALESPSNDAVRERGDEEPKAVPREPHRLSPRARRLARTEAAAAEPAAQNGHRALIAAKTTEAWQSIPHFAVTGELDAEPLRAALVESRAGQESVVTYTDLLLRSVAAAVQAAGWDADPVIALAVATPGGVVNPVVRNLLSHSVDEVARDREALVARARSGRLTPADVDSATTTLSNLGSGVVDHFTGVITPGQRSLFTIGSIQKRPIVVDDGVLARLTMFVTIVVDHRVFDGADAAALLRHLDDAIRSNPSERIAR